MAGLSIWWPTPARSESHFSAEDLARSAAYHRPLRRVGLAGLSAKLGLLTLAGIVAGDLGRLAGAGWPPEPERSWFDTLTARPVLLGAALAVLALRTPAIVVDGWFEYRFRRGVDGYRPLPLRSFGATVLALTVGLWLLLVVLAGLGYRVAAERRTWPALFIAAVVVVIAGAAGGERRFRQLSPARERALDPSSSVCDELDALASRFDIGSVSFLVGHLPGGAAMPGPSASGTGSGPGAGPVAASVPGDVANAAAIGLGRNRRIVVTDSLLSEHRETRDFVVAHELTHLARGHLAVQTAVTVASYGALIVTLALLVDTGRPWSWFGLSPLDPLGLPVLVAVMAVLGSVIAPLTAWISRVMERSADAGAMAVVGPPAPAAAVGLYIDSTAELDPPRWAKLYADHPAPAERLEFLGRHRRRLRSEAVGPEIG